ncbi:uncharacterized protein [Physcomitrium patens]|uniref:uncharacterized protein isoform X3 n=1 Tax=Physcomitrium patens TaxID=3218 RepID=UPI000D174C34|nr:tRNA pseudouridine(38/39) synthase-like isoform X3 [Physcomitrium patens]|eukprot:XP_024384439.1 tRNA pseudouridine(38/39) synthase-like isoform X3 [Physcomitrella patens]
MPTSLEKPRAEMDLRPKVAELEALVSELRGQNEILRKENGILSSRLAEFESGLKTKPGREGIFASESLLQTPERSEDAAQQVKRVLGLKCLSENPVSDIPSTESKLPKVKGKRNKKRNAMEKSMSHYCSRHVALKVMYLGTGYQGFASQAGSPNTVETELFAALHRTRMITGTAAEAKYTRCGRTDKGVSAVGQVVALYLRSKIQPRRQENIVSTGDAEEELNSKSSISAQGVPEGEDGSFTKNSGFVMDLSCIDHSGDRVAMARASRKEEEQFARTASDEDEYDYVGILNRALPEDIRVLGWCPVPPGFNARFSCMYREYKYFFIDDGLNIDVMKFACKQFEGEHDFTNFCKMDAANVHNYMRTITHFDIIPSNEKWGGKSVWIMNVKGTAFLWHQVRCMAAVLFMVGAGHEKPTIVEELLDVKKIVRKPQYIMASETPLLLFHCGYQGLSFRCHPDAVKRLRLHLESLLQTSIVNSSLLLQGLLELPSPAKKPTQPGDSQSRKGLHVPMLKRPTEPTYEERRRMLGGSQPESI